MTYSPTFFSDFGLQHKFNVFQQIRNDVVKRNESWDIFIAQKRGAGKSAMALRMALLIDPNFTLDHVCFRVSDFVRLLTSRQRPGTVLIFDDLGTQEGGSSRRWQRQESHDLADIMQLNRTDGIITIATSLELDRSEKRLRAGFSLLIDPGTKLSSADTRGNGLASRIVMRKKGVDVFEGTTYWQYWRYASGGRIVAIDISHPPAELWKEYRMKRDQFLVDVKDKGKDTEDTKRNRHDSPPLTNKEWSGEMNIRPNRVAPMREIMKQLYDVGAVDKDKGMANLKVKKILKNVLGYTTDRSCQQTMEKWYNYGFAQNVKAKVDGKNTSVVWLTPKAVKFVLREPLLLNDKT